MFDIDFKSLSDQELSTLEFEVYEERERREILANSAGHIQQLVSNYVNAGGDIHTLFVKATAEHEAVINSTEEGVDDGGSEDQTGE